jgi:hypothetical protein
MEAVSETDRIATSHLSFEFQKRLADAVYQLKGLIGDRLKEAIQTRVEEDTLSQQ